MSTTSTGHAEKGHDVRAELARAVVESQWKLLELKTSGLSLEDIFLQLTTKDLGEGAAGESQPSVPDLNLEDKPAASEN